jgi:hypothetical protein
MVDGDALSGAFRVDKETHMIGRKERTGDNRQGFAMATTLLIILVLSVIALGAAWLATTEKRTSFAESVHLEALFSADAGGEAAVNFIRLNETPPPITEFVNMTVMNQGETVLQGDQSYDYICRFVAKRPRPGWGLEFLDYDYEVVANGEAASKGRSAVQLLASRLYREGY